MNDFVLIPVAFFAFLAILVVVPAWLRYRSRMYALRTLREAVDKGRDVDAGLIERFLATNQRQVGKGFGLFNLVLGVGALSIGVALGLAVHLLGHRLGLDADSAAGMMTGAFVNGCIGIGLTALGLISLNLFSARDRPAIRWDYAVVLAFICLFLGVSGMSVGVGLWLASAFHVVVAGNEDVATGLAMGALVNSCTGLGFTGLGVFILRSFVMRRDHDA